MADPHFGHSNIAGPKVSRWKSGYRNFETVEEMDAAIINNINLRVAQDDELYIAGDFCFGGHEKTPDYRNRIICRNVHIIRGNHDKHITKYRHCFNSVEFAAELVFRGRDGAKHLVYVHHYGCRVWLGSHQGSLHAYGHSHGSLPPQGRSEDVGVDRIFKLFGEYRPISEEEFVELTAHKDIYFGDHHSAETNTR